MKNFIGLLVFVFVLMGCNYEKKTPTPSLKDALEGKFTIGAALNTQQVAGQDSQAIAIVLQHFNSIVAENCMKMESIQPQEGVFTFDDADAFVKFGEDNNMEIIGHTLVWHSQAPDWMFVDENGADVSRDVLIERMRNHIQTTVTRYKGRIKGWDVVNEAMMDDGSWRESKWYQIIGPEFIQLAFEFAHEADPEAELYYNDYAVSIAAKCDGIYNMVKDLIDNGARVDGVGMQGHISMNDPTIEQMETSIVKLAGLAGKVMITELDLTVLPWPSKQLSAEVSLSYELESKYNPYPDGMPDSVSVAFNQRYADFFQLFLKHQDKIGRVTLWGVNDTQSWRNYWPIAGRKDYPVLFDREYKAKPVVAKIIEMAEGK
ncbi:MAG TPA: endo-1,4-beta-xylanase [Fermentimonas sp.]|nr:endo-1,4-beta-xylanase [Fermentimonas sp.]